MKTAHRTIKISVWVLAGLLAAVWIVSGTETAFSDSPPASEQSVEQTDDANAQADAPDAAASAPESGQPDPQAEETDDPSFSPRPRRGPGMRPDGFRGPGERPEWTSRRGTDDAVQVVDPDAEEPMEAINLNNVEMRQIVQKIAEWTGKPVIPVNDEIMQTRITIYSPSTVTRRQALSLLMMALQARGILVEQLDDRVMLRPLSSVRLGSIPTLGPDEPLARVEDKTRIVEKWFRLNNYSPNRLIQIITPLVAEYGYAVAEEDASRVAVIDTVENLMRIERLIHQLDLPEIDQQVEKIIELRYADPTEVVQMIQMILTDSQAAPARGARGGRGGAQATSPAGGQAGGQAGAPGGRQGAPQDGGQPPRTATSVVIASEGAVPVRMFPLARQRWILVRGTRDDIRRIEEWVERLDIEEMEEMRQTVVQVRYADVREVARMVQNTLQQMPGTDLRANIVVEALQQTSQIVIYGSEANRVMVERLIAQIDLPKEDFFVERTFRLKHADPDQIKNNIEQLYTDTAQQQPFGRMVQATARRPEDTVRVIAYTMLKQVTVIASPQNMDRIARQIEEEWDKPLDIERDQYRIVSLNNSDPVKLADLLKRLFTEETTGAGTQNLWRMLFGGTQDSRQKIVGSLYGMLTFEPVPDTKKLIVISQVPEAYDVIERMILLLDARDEADVPRVITLKYADPEALCDQLNAILNESGTTATIPRSVRGLSAYTTGTNQAVTTSEEGSGTITPWWTRQRLDTSQMPTSNLIGRVRFVPVHRSKAILILAPPEYLKDITAMIEVLDRPGMQVMIKAVIMEIGLSDQTSLGIQLSSSGAFSSAMGPNALTALNELSSQYQRGSFSAVMGSDINVLVDLLIKHANGRVLNQPTLWTKDNEEAIFIKGQKVAFITGEQTANTGSTQTSYEFEDVGVTLRIRPNITPEKAVDLTINLNISQIESDMINDQRVRSNLDSTTRMIINDGQSVMMGGILTQRDEFIEHKIPLFGDLPLLGGLFRHEMVNKTNNELLVFVTPYVVDGIALGSLPADPEAVEVIESARRRLNENVESLNRMFMRDPVFVPED